ncbi:putative mitochondrial import inner membrane translocase subunit TIM22 [Helianthus annuus]|nr:putative mitochondrial import inner membrane translocase subunit TIM22 [Helianthus annuus]
MHNPITYLETKHNELRNGFKGWLAKQSLPVEAAVVTLTGAAKGAIFGGFTGAFAKDSSTAPPPDDSVNPNTMASFQKSQAPAGGPLIHARNYAVISGVNAGISSVLKRLRGKEDVQTR